MLDNSLLRFVILVAVLLVVSWLLQRFLSGWGAASAAHIETEEAYDEQAEEPTVPHLDPPRARSEARIQQPLEAPEPDSLMSETVRPQQDIARRIRADSHAIDKAHPKRTQHRRPHRNSQPARHRKIQL